MLSLLIIEDDIIFSLLLSTWLGRKGFKVKVVNSISEGRKVLQGGAFQLVMSDIRLPDGDGIELLKWSREQGISIPFIMMTSYANIQSAVQSIKLGASDYVAKPVNQEELLQKINEVLNVDGKTFSKEKPSVKKVKNSAQSDDFLTGNSKAALLMYKHVRLVAPTDMSVLITGSSGTGKEYVARYLHEHSNRSKAPFIPVDCGAIPKDLAVSEFFGHVKGSFTGAIDNKTGAFEAAEGGTIFLDEIGNLSYDIQVQLLRALQERKIKPVGTNREISTNIRLISATNENLHTAIEAGNFREDLYHRINEFTIRIPDLREREDDLFLFAEYFLGLANRELNKSVNGFSDEVKELFGSFPWPGNLRQLKNVVKYSTLLASGELITKSELPEELRSYIPKDESVLLLKSEEYEREQIRKALREAGNNKSKAAQLLGVDRKTLYNKLKQYNI